MIWQHYSISSNSRGWILLGGGPITENQLVILLETIYQWLYNEIIGTFYPYISNDRCAAITFYFPVRSDGS